jgi:hypothetical protein
VGALFETGLKLVGEDLTEGFESIGSGIVLRVH